MEAVQTAAASLAKRSTSSFSSPTPEATNHLTNDADTVAALEDDYTYDAVELKTL